MSKNLGTFGPFTLSRYAGPEGVTMVQIDMHGQDPEGRFGKGMVWADLPYWEAVNLLEAMTLELIKQLPDVKG